MFRENCRSAVLQRATVPAVIALVAPFVLSGCSRLAMLGDRGKVIDPHKVQTALERTPYKLRFTRGPRPSGFSGAIYGSASNKRGASIHFGFFIAPGPD